jgi:hypothetical protein
MAVNLSPIGNGFQFLSVLGQPLTGGLLYTYQAGSTTPLTTYTDPSGLIANTNPIVLGVDGRPPSEIWFADGYNYKFVLADSANVVIATYDNLYGIPTANAVASPTVIPTGLISLWSGSIGSIPSGWVLCDGNNSTPNLTDRFIVGAGNSYAVAGQGGSADSIVVSHTHTATSTTTATDSGHTHGIAYSGTLGFSGGGGFAGTAFGGAVNQATESGTANITATTTTTNASTGVSGTNANLPPYYALAYIMKS